MNPKREIFTIRNGIVEDSRQNFFIDYEYMISSSTRLSELEKLCGMPLEKDTTYNKWIFYKKDKYLYTISRLDNVFCVVPLKLIDTNFKEHFDSVLLFISYIVSNNCFSNISLNKFYYSIYFYVPQNLISNLVDTMRNIFSNGIKPGSLLGKTFIYPFYEFYKIIYFDKDFTLVDTPDNIMINTLSTENIFGNPIFQK